MASRVSEAAEAGMNEAGAAGAMCIVTPGGFGTVSSSIIALPAPGSQPGKPVWRFAPGRPGEVPFEPIEL